jgi:hypothetical protein
MNNPKNFNLKKKKGKQVLSHKNTPNIKNIKTNE